MKSEHYLLKIVAMVAVAFVATQTVFTQPKPTATPDAAKISTEEELIADLKLGPCKNSERLAAVKDIFLRLGVPADAIKTDGSKDLQNVLVTKKGRTDEIVVVGAHYDKVSDGCGIIDNWSGIVILAHLYRTLKMVDTQKTYVFVAFDKEEQGLLGAKAMAKGIPKESRLTYCAMVNLDSFGLGYPLILENASSTKLVKVAKDLAAELKMPINSVSLAGAADADSSAFKEKDIPAITLSALTGKWPEVLHGPKDKFENVVTGSVRIGYQFGLRYLAKIDETGCSQFR